MTESERYQMARKHVRERKEFWIHIAMFVIVNAGLIALNLVQQPDKLWFHWVLIGWGAGLLLHSFQVFGSNWEERKVQEFMKREEEKEKAQSNSSAT